MTVDEIRKLTPEQMNRMAEIRTEIEDLESELEQLIKGEKPRRSAKPKARKKPARKQEPTPAPLPTPPVADVASPELDAVSAPAIAAEPVRAPEISEPVSVPESFAPVAPVESVLTRLALPKQGEPSGAELDS